MEEPYVLAKLQKSSSSASDLKIYAGCTSTGVDKFSSRELVTALDSQGINIYNIRSNQVATSYSLPLATKFQCPPASRVDRSTMLRRTYAAVQTSTDDMKIQCWKETYSNRETEVTSYAINQALSGLYILEACILIVYVDGTMERLTEDLKTSIDIIPVTAYIPNGSEFTMLSHRLLPLISGQEPEICLVAIVDDALQVCHIRLSGSPKASNDAAASFYKSTIPGHKQFWDVQKSQIAIGEKGQIAFATIKSRYVAITTFNATMMEVREVCRIPSTRATSVQLRWLNDTQLICSSSAQCTIWDVVYLTCQNRATIPDDTEVIATIPQKVTSGTQVSRTVLLLASPSDLYLSTVTYKQTVTLLDALGKGTQSRSSDIWLQDVPIQSTWKDSLTSITRAAKSCLVILGRATTAAEVDAAMEHLLFSNDKEQSRSTKKANKKALQQQKSQHTSTLANGNGLTNGKVSMTTDSSNVSKTKEEATQVTVHSEAAGPVKTKFASYQTEVSLSISFVSRLLQIIYVDLPLRNPQAGLPNATIDYILKKGLLSMTALSGTTLSIETIIRNSPGLELRLIAETAGLLPSHFVTILEIFLKDSARLHKVVSIIMTRMDRYDDRFVISSLRQLQQDDIEFLLELLAHDLQRRSQQAPATHKLTVSDDILCGMITSLLDTLGLSTIIFSRKVTGLISDLRSDLVLMITQNDQIGLLESCVAEFLMKARLVEAVRRPKNLIGSTLEISNPEPEPRLQDMALDKVKRPEKHQTQRAKAQARVQSIGSLYTIETLQL